MKRQTGVYMKHFMIWPILVPAIAFFPDDSLSAHAMYPQYDAYCADYCPGPYPPCVIDSWHSRDFDSFLIDPPCPLYAHSLVVEGTITESPSGCIYDADYDMNADD